MFLFYFNIFKIIQEIRINIENKDFSEEKDKIIWASPKTKFIVEWDVSSSVIEKGYHSFKESYGLNEFISYIEYQATILDALLVQAKSIVYSISYVLSKFPPQPPFYQIEENVSKIWIVQILEPLLYKYIVCLK